MSQSPRKSPIKLTGRNVLLALFCATNLASIIGNFYFVKKIDQKYSVLIDRSVPVLNLLNKVTASAAFVMYQTYPALFAENAHNQTESLKLAREALAEEMKSRVELVNTSAIGVNATEIAELQAAGSEYSRIGNEIVEKYSANRDDEAGMQREQKLRPALQRYLAVTSALSKSISQVGADSNNRLSETTNKGALTLLGLGGWPVFLSLGVILLITPLILISIFITGDNQDVSDV